MYITSLNIFYYFIVSSLVLWQTFFQNYYELEGLKHNLLFYTALKVKTAIQGGPCIAYN